MALNGLQVYFGKLSTLKLILQKWTNGGRMGKGGTNGSGWQMYDMFIVLMIRKKEGKPKIECRAKKWV